MEVSGQLHTLANLPPGKEPRYPLDRRLGGPQSRFGRCGEENILALPEIEPGPYSQYSDTILTELTRLLLLCL
jgi:hypothetical protein